MPNYQLGKIYKLEHNDMFYIGSTCQLLCQRKAKHHCDMKRRESSVYSYLRDKNWQEVSISLIEDYPCNSKAELEERENFYIKQHKTNPKCLNFRYSVNDTDSKNETKDKANKRAAELVECECGTVLRRSGLFIHRKSFTHHQIMGTEYTGSRSKEQLEKANEKSLERAKTTITCECGAIIKYGSRYLHRKSKAHQEAINKNTN
jgi:hypothetical protein